MNTMVMIMVDTVMDIAILTQRAIPTNLDTNTNIMTAPLISRPLFLRVKTLGRISS